MKRRRRNPRIQLTPKQFEALRRGCERQRTRRRSGPKRVDYNPKLPEHRTALAQIEKPRYRILLQVRPAVSAQRLRWKEVGKALRVEDPQDAAEEAHRHFLDILHERKTRKVSHHPVRPDEEPLLEAAARIARDGERAREVWQIATVSSRLLAESEPSPETARAAIILPQPTTTDANEFIPRFLSPVLYERFLDLALLDPVEVFVQSELVPVILTKGIVPGGVHPIGFDPETRPRIDAKLGTLSVKLRDIRCAESPEAARACDRLLIINSHSGSADHKITEDRQNDFHRYIKGDLKSAVGHFRLWHDVYHEFPARWDEEVRRYQTIMRRAETLIDGRDLRYRGNPLAEFLGELEMLRLCELRKGLRRGTRYDHELRLPMNLSYHPAS